MGARSHKSSEKEHLLAASHYSSPPSPVRFRSPNHTHSNKQYASTRSLRSSSSSFIPGSRHSFSQLPLCRQFLIAAMVAIPTYMLASTAVTSLGPLWPRNSVIRSPRPNPLPQTTTASSSSTIMTNPSAAGQDSSNSNSNNPFASVLGPHISTNFPDPAIIHVDGVSYAFATNNRKPAPERINIQVATSTDNQTWTMVENFDALPNLAAWETGAGVWAPDVVRLDDGTFVLYYADNVIWSPSHHCVGAATSQSVMGPYTPLPTPFACPDPATLGGAIDPDGFLDESTGKRYVVYKVDGNSNGHGGSCSNTVAPIVPTPLMLQEVDAQDGLTLIGPPIQLLDRDDLDGPLIEAPTLHRSAEGVYFLFYSSNCFTTPKYDVAYATAPSITGTYTRSPRPLLVTSDADLTGPGGMDIVKGGDLIVFHGHMTINNDPLLRQQAEQKAQARNTTITNVNVPLVRGMWTGTARFVGTEVLLS